MKALSLLVAGVAGLWSVPGAHAAPPFSAICVDHRTEAYRYERGSNGSLLSDEWEKDRFFAKWTFEYSGGRTVLVDGEETLIVAEAGPVLALISRYSNGASAGVWTYVVNLELRRIVAAQVNGHSLLGSGVKTRSVQFDCEFK